MTYAISMTNSRALMNQFQILRGQHAEFLADVWPLQNRLHSFLMKNSVRPWFSHNIANEDGAPDLSEYVLYLEGNENAVSFYCDNADMDGMTTYQFQIPAEYFADPDKWEADLLARKAADIKLVQDAYERMAPGVAEEFGLEVIVPFVDKTTVSAWVVTKGQSGLTIGSPNRHRLVANSFTINRATGEMVQSTLM